MPHLKVDYEDIVELLPSLVGSNENVLLFNKYTVTISFGAFIFFRVHILEEQLRDVEIKAQKKIQEEEKKNREFMVWIQYELHVLRLFDLFMIIGRPCFFLEIYQ